MGGVFGKPNVLQVSAINSTINKSILTIAGKTSTDNTVTQLIEASGGSTVSGNQQFVDVKSNMSSIVKASQQSDFNTTIKNDLVQELEKKSVALLGAFDGLMQNNNVDLKTKVENSVENLNMMELTPICAMNSELTQNIIAKEGSNVTNNSQTIKADFVQSCTTIADSNMTIMSDIANSFNQKAKLTTENPLNVINDMLISTMIPIAVILIAIVIGFTIMVGAGKLDITKIAMSKRNPGEPDNTQMQEGMMQDGMNPDETIMAEPMAEGDFSNNAQTGIPLNSSEPPIAPLIEPAVGQVVETAVETPRTRQQDNQYL